MYCRFCGKEIADDANFCSHCGKKLAYDPNAKETKKEKVVDENLKAFKKDYTKGFLPGLIWFAALNVIASTCLTIGAIIVLIIYASEGNAIPEGAFSLQEAIALLYEARDKSYYIIIPLFYTIGYLVSSVVAMIVGKRVAYGKKEGFYPLQNIRKLSFLELIIVIFVAFGLWGIGVIIGNIPSFFNEGGISEIEIIFGNHQILYLIQAIVCAPIIEEFFFRKLMIDRTAGRGEGLAVLASATLFGLMHGNLGQFFLAFLIGLLFGVVYLKTRNIRYTMFLHFMINLTASLPEIFAMANINIELGWYIAVASLMVIGIVMAIIFRKKEIFRVNKECEYDGKMINRSVGYLVFFILTLVTLATTTIVNLFQTLLIGLFEYFIWTDALELIPVSAFIVFILLYIRQLRKVFKGKPKEEIDENVALQEIEDIGEEEIEELNKLDE